ncbi:unnamed protein product [Fraxinus pennsylvanica]|uniref:Uncharacterized protein n=1 Tax=Fraxinus pennsylvanica TaxID=56036 RepID=A0AAD2AKP0_9LAMI|nr:unnamed protein product [Fraxinus pennsylvanica]
MIRANIEEYGEATMAQFLNYLNREIANVVELQHYVEMDDLLHMSMKVEKQLKRKGTTRYSSGSSGSNPSWKSRWDNEGDVAVLKGRSKFPKWKEKNANKVLTKAESQPSRNRDIKCFSDSDYKGMPELEEISDEAKTEYAMGELLVTRRALSAQIKANDLEQQRENIFHIRCCVNNTECSVIIDGGNCTDVASTTLVEKLGLTLLKHLNYIDCKWLNDSSDIKVNQRVLINLSIGRYQDEVMCDVVPMYAGHILLGRPWQYDRKVMDDGYKNMNNFMKDGKSITLAPLTPQQMFEDQIKLKGKEEMRVKEKKIKRENCEVANREGKELSHKSEKKKKTRQKTKRVREKKKRGEK